MVDGGEGRRRNMYGISRRGALQDRVSEQGLWRRVILYQLVVGGNGLFAKGSSHLIETIDN